MLKQNVLLRYGKGVKEGNARVRAANAHFELRSLGGPSMRPSTLVSSTSKSAFSSLASSFAKLSLSWNPIAPSCSKCKPT